MPFGTNLRRGFAAIVTAAVLGPGGAAAQEWARCAFEGEFCSFSGTEIVRYGADGKFRYHVHTDGIPCTERVFGTSVSGGRNACWIHARDGGRDVRQQLEQATSQLRELRGQLQQRDRRIAELETRVRDAGHDDRPQLEEAHRQLRELRGQLQERNQRIAELEKRVTELRAKPDNMRSRLQEKTERIRELTQKVDRLEARLEEIGG